MLQIHPPRRERVVKVAKTIATAIGAATLLLAMSGCASIPQRAWDNGASMSRSDAYWRMMNGERGFQVTRSLYNSMDPYRSLHQARQYQPSRRW
jgi:hypothetical protein